MSREDKEEEVEELRSVNDLLDNSNDILLKVDKFQIEVVI